MAFPALFRNLSLNQVSRNTFRLVRVPNTVNPSLVRLTQTCARNSLKPTLLQNAVVRKVTALPVRHSSDHRLVWKLEKLMSAALLGIIPITFIAPCWLFNDLFAFCVVLHQHWGLEAITIDYVRPLLFGNVIPKLALMLLYTVSAITLGGLLYFNHTDVGIANFVAAIWTKNRPKEEVVVEDAVEE